MHDGSNHRSKRAKEEMEIGIDEASGGVREQITRIVYRY